MYLISSTWPWEEPQLQGSLGNVVIITITSSLGQEDSSRRGNGVDTEQANP